MKSIKLLIILLLSALFVKAQNYSQPMSYKDYGFYGQANFGSGRYRLTAASAYIELGDSLHSRKGLLFPRGNKDSVINPVRGLVFFDIPSGKLQVYDGSVWSPLGAGTGGAGDNNYPTGVTFTGGTLAIQRSGLSDISTSLDGRYLQSFTETDPTALLKSNNLSDLVSAATARINLGATTVGNNLFTLTNPSALGYLRINADNTVTHRSYANVKVDLSLDNVNNTSDANKPVSTATQTALNAKQNTITLTTTGTSGPATLTGSTLNIPQYSSTTNSIGEDWYMATDWGMVDDSVTDNTTPLRVLMDTIAARKRSAKVWFNVVTKGHYMFSGSLMDGSNCNCQIKFPTLSINDKQYSVILAGWNFMPFSPTVYESTPLPHAPVLHSTISGTSGSSFFGVGAPSNGLSYVVPGFENLIICTTPNPNLSGVNFERVTNTYFKDVAVLAGASQAVPLMTEPTDSTSFGVKFPRHSSGVSQRVDGSLNIMAFYNGFTMPEGAMINDVGVHGVKRGVIIRSSIGTSFINRIISNWTPITFWYDSTNNYNNIKNEHELHILQAHIEKWIPSYGVDSHWYNFQSDLYDPGNQLKGEIAYRSTAANYGNIGSHFIRFGGDSLCYHPIGKICSLWANTIGSSSPTTYPEDPFTASNTTDIDGRVLPVGTSLWSIGLQATGSDHIGISSNEAYYSNTGGYAKYVFSVPSTDLTVVGTIGSAISDGQFMILRWTDNNNNVIVNTKTCSIDEYVAGSQTSLYAGSGTSVAGDSIKCILNGNSLSVYRNTTLVTIKTISSTLNGTNAGIFYYLDATSRMAAIKTEAN